MYKIILKTFVKLVPFLIAISIATLYGYLLLNGYNIGTEKAKKYAHIYFNIGLFGYALWLLVFSINIYCYYNKHDTNCKDDSAVNTINATNNKDVLIKNNQPKICKWILTLWIAYTVVWVMELPFTYDIVYFILGGAVFVCWWKNRKK